METMQDLKHHLLADQYLTPQQRKLTRQQQQKKLYTVRGVMEKLDIPLRGQGQDIIVQNLGNDVEFRVNQYILQKVKGLFEYGDLIEDADFKKGVHKSLQHLKKFKPNVLKNISMIHTIERQDHALTQQQLNKAYQVDFLVKDFPSVADIIYNLKIRLVERELERIGGVASMIDKKKKLLGNINKSDVIKKSIRELMTKVNEMYDEQSKRKSSSLPSSSSLTSLLFGRKKKHS